MANSDITIVERKVSDLLANEMTTIIANIQAKHPNLEGMPCVAISSPDSILAGDVQLDDAEILAQVEAVFDRHGIGYYRGPDRVLSVGPSASGGQYFAGS